MLCVARRQGELDRVVAEIEAAGGSAYGYACDLTDPAATDALVEQVLGEHAGVDMLVNNAGRSIRRSLEYSYDRMHDFERTMAINFFGPVRLILGLLPRMRERKFGHVVNIVTWGVQMKAPKFTAYIASKTALDSFARIAGRETWFDNVTFTNLRLDLVRTDMIVATDTYRRAPAKSPEQAAALVVRALEDRPITISTVAGRVGEVLNLVAPSLMDAGMGLMAARMPDSRAARSHVEGDSPDRLGVQLLVLHSERIGEHDDVALVLAAGPLAAGDQHEPFVFSLLAEQVDRALGELFLRPGDDLGGAVDHRALARDHLDQLTTVQLAEVVHDAAAGVHGVPGQHGLALG